MESRLFRRLRENRDATRSMRFRKEPTFTDEQNARYESATSRIKIEAEIKYAFWTSWYRHAKSFRRSLQRKVHKVKLPRGYELVNQFGTLEYKSENGETQIYLLIATIRSSKK